MSPPCVVKSFLSQCSITYRVKYLNWSWKFVSIFLFLFYLRTRMGWIQCSVVSTRQKFVLKFYEMNMILRSLKEMEESKVSMNNFLLFIINGRRMERNFKLKRETFRKSSWKIKNCVTREDRFHLLRSKIKFPFDDTSINFYFFFFNPRCFHARHSCLATCLHPSVIPIFWSTFCACVKRRMKSVMLGFLIPNWTMIISAPSLQRRHYRASLRVQPKFPAWHTTHHITR